MSKVVFVFCAVVAVCVVGAVLRDGSGEVEVRVDGSFPVVTITPSWDEGAFCSYTLTGVYESRAQQGFFDPRVDSDIADTRVALGDLAWEVVEGGAAGAMRAVGTCGAGCGARFERLELAVSGNASVRAGRAACGLGAGTTVVWDYDAEDYDPSKMEVRVKQSFFKSKLFLLR